MQPTVTRRDFNCASIVSLITLAMMPERQSALAQAAPKSHSARREVIRQQLPGDPERDLVLVEVNYRPGTGSPAHKHLNGVMAIVVAGSILSKVGNDSEKTYKAGEAWWEPPGAIHRVSRNASDTAPATLLAIYIVPRGAGAAEMMKPI